jgi:ABC-type branched-subunit amino acid transport system ATPase component
MSGLCAARARGLTKLFDDVIALDRVDLDVAPGQIHGIVGPNGAGKTTLLGMTKGPETTGAAPSSAISPASTTRSDRPCTSLTSTRTGGTSPTATG